MSATRFERLWAEVQAEFPGARIVNRAKAPWWFRAAFALGAWLARRDFDNFATTLNRTIYVPVNWDMMTDAAKYCLLRHERMHIAQAARWTFPVFAFLYGFALPAFFTMRARFEREAYAEQIRAIVETGGLRWATDHDDFAAWIADTFTGPTYFFMQVGWGRVHAWARAEIDAALEARRQSFDG